MTLGQWVRQQRTLYREGRLPPERIQHLRGMGFNVDHVPPTGESFTGDEYFDSRLRELVSVHFFLFFIFFYLYEYKLNRQLSYR